MYFTKVLNIWRIRWFYNRTRSRNPGFITGFIDAEGCLNMMVTLSKGKPRVLGRFIIELHEKDLNLLYEIQDFCGDVGSIIITKKVAWFSVGF